MYIQLVKENPSLYNEEDLSSINYAFLQGVVCVKNALADMTDRFVNEREEEQALDDKSKKLLSDCIEYLEGTFDEFGAEFLVLMITEEAD